MLIMINHWIWIFAAVAVIGAATAVAVSVHKNKPARKSFQELLKDSLSVDELTGAICSAWFREKAAEYPEEKVGLLLYADRQFINLLGFECPQEADLEHYALQLLIQKEGSGILAYRLINFDRVQPELKLRLDETGKLTVEI